MTFPDRTFAEAGKYAEAYFSEVAEAAATVDRARLSEAAAILTRVYSEGGMAYSCGNGGSAAIANHLVCDHCKLVQTDTGLRPRVISLSTTIEIITAISNDLSYDEVYVYQLRTLARPSAVSYTISSSG